MILKTSTDARIALGISLVSGARRRSLPRRMFVTARAVGCAGAVVLLGLSAFAKPPRVAPPPLNAVAVDPLVKIFRDAPADFLAQNITSATMDAARGEHYTFQIVMPGSAVDVSDLQATATEFRRVRGSGPAAQRAQSHERNSRFPAPRIRYVGYVGSSVSMDTTASDQLRPAPAMYPDPLLTHAPAKVHSRENQPIWLSGQAPVDAEPGDYIATATISAKLLGASVVRTMPLHLKVFPATIRDTRLNVTLWYQMWYFNGHKMPERFSDDWFAIVKLYARNMREHRQNWGWVETHEAMKFSRGADGKLRVDFSNFDRWVKLFLDAGFTHIEGQHFAFRTAGWRGPFSVQVWQPGSDGKWAPEKVPADSTAARDFASEYFPLLQAHLREQGWLDKYVQHVGDEPIDANADSYTTAAQLLKTFAPDIKIMDACQSQKVAGLVDIWIPQLDHFAKGYDFFRQRAQKGEDVWFYTCMYPTGEYANRFLELPLIKTRLLHWINFQYGATGYLHWGYNYWPPNVWEDAADHRQQLLPGGDANIVYPDPDRLEVVDSIRYEAMRDGIEDHELLSQLDEKDEAAAQALSGRVIHGFTKYETDVKAFRQVRRELLEKLSQ